MHLKTLMIRSAIAFWMLIAFSGESKAQSDGCIFKDTLFTINFGSGKNVQDFNLNALKNYKRDYTSCPNDGYYAFTSETGNCFNGDWITLNTDHTPNDTEGKMMLVNASQSAGDFFIAVLSGFKTNTTYEFATWMMNVCKINSGCPPLPPNILIRLETNTGRKLVEFKTGQLLQSNDPHWSKYFGLFTTTSDATSLTLKMTNTTNGGCGNDFVMDDITFRECYPLKAPVKVESGVVPVDPIKPVPVAVKPSINNTPQKTLKKDILVISNIPAEVTTPSTKEVSKPKMTNMSLPEPLINRENPVIKQIEAPYGEFLIELYDNGIIDGDTVSIYHNNKLIVSRAGLSAKPVSFRITIDPEHPHHELVMVADNLGSIPPNTSLMIVTGNGKRYEIFISSSEQKNAKVVIDKNK